MHNQNRKHSRKIALSYVNNSHLFLSFLFFNQTKTHIVLHHLKCMLMALRCIEAAFQRESRRHGLER